MKKQKPLIVITVDGGLVQNVNVSPELSDAVVRVIDHDTEDPKQKAVCTEADELVKKAFAAGLLTNSEDEGAAEEAIETLKKVL